MDWSSFGDGSQAMSNGISMKAVPYVGFKARISMLAITIVAAQSPPS